MKINLRTLFRLFVGVLGVVSVWTSISLHPVPVVAQATSVVQATPLSQSTPRTAPFQVPPLPYAYDALTPSIDVETMHLHHDKHHQAYVDKLNGAIARHPELASRTAEELLLDLPRIPEDIRTIVYNNAGAHLNHSMFWENMAPGQSGVPSGELAAAINQTFGSFDNFKQQFNEAGVKVFGSGWAWLVMAKNGNLRIMSTPNQDTPIMTGLIPLLGSDVWEHAYYLTYQNRRADYLKAWWRVVNWDRVDQRFRLAKQALSQSHS